MPDTLRTLADLQALLADNTSGDISPQDVRDMLVSTYQLDYSADVSVTGAVTATIGKWHVCSGTSADYTVTLPAASGNAGKLVGFRMSSALTKLVTIDGNSTELIDGQATQVFTAKESTILFCDGTDWQTVGGQKISLFSQSALGSSYTITTSGVFQDTGLSISIPTTGDYLIGYNVRAGVQATGGTSPYYIVVRLYNDTTAAAISNSERLGILTSATTQQQGQSAFTHQVTVTGATTLKLQASRNQIGGSPTWTGAVIYSDVAGYTTLNYSKIV